MGHREFNVALRHGFDTHFLYDFGQMTQCLRTPSSSIKFKSKYLPHMVGVRIKGDNACGSTF